MFRRIKFLFMSDKALVNKRKKMNHYHGTVLDKSFHKLCKRLDNIDEELTRRSNKRYKRRKTFEKIIRKKSSKTYGVHREHGWYLPNDD